MISVKNLTKRFGNITAVDDVTLEVERGEVLGFLGPNGAGKSTTMKMVTGFLQPTGGSVSVCGHDLTSDAIRAKEQIGYLPEGAPAYPDMTPRAFLGFIADIRGLSGGERSARLDEVIAKTHIENVLDQSIETLSKGFKRRVGLAQAILHDPPVLVLDEPTDGLDPNQKHEVRTLIRDMAKDKAIVLSTHILEEVEALCTRVIIIAKGRIVFDGTPLDLETRSRHHNAVSITLRPESTKGVREALEALEGVSSVEDISRESGGFSYMAYPSNGQPILGSISQLVRDHSWEVDDLHVERGRLDEVFREMTEASEGGRS